MISTDKAHIVKGTMKQFWQPLMLRKISKDVVIKAIRWFEEIRDIDESIGNCTYLIFELLSSVSEDLPYGDAVIITDANFCSICFLAGSGRRRYIKLCLATAQWFEAYFASRPRVPFERWAGQGEPNSRPSY